MQFKSLRTIYAVIAMTALSSCSTMVSKEMLPDIEYRENPKVVVIEYDDYEKLQKDCFKQHKKAGYYSGCAWVPQDPTKTCIIRIMAGDEKTKKHEFAHCQGHADTYLPWKVDYNYYDILDF